ncbi:Ig-like domain-containing protein [Olsenella phocaeensis]|uniref:Ig-like domain-containing protein n=1 Tax=Olsenella phocaeensis TaxID=1852385 RepID=UPI00093015FE|nr:Ig-like domain-containing protein [Olsenella phocaeensis]
MAVFSYRESPIRLRLRAFALTALFAMVTMLAVLPSNAIAREAKAVTATISDLRITRINGTTATSVSQYDTFYLAMNWDASQNGANLHEGDYFDITLRSPTTCASRPTRRRATSTSRAPMARR